MRNCFPFLFFLAALLFSCSKYTITNLSSAPITLNIQYHFTDSVTNSVPFQMKQFNRELKKKEITHLKSDISGMTGDISFDVLSKKSTKISFLIVNARYQKNNKASPDMTVLITQTPSKADTVFQIIGGKYITNKFKGNITNYVAPNRYYHYYYRNSN